MKTIVMDLDDTLTTAGVSEYADAPIREDVVTQLRRYRETGFKITILTARNMRTYEGDVKKITAHTLPTIIEWLDRNNVPYDDIVVGKPWCGHEGFYVDDKAIRPDEFVNLNYEEICKVIKTDVNKNR
jgi:capsule biosynthesis phosphatase